MKKIFLLTLLCTAFVAAMAQNSVKIKGRVIDKTTREALIGAVVVLKSSPSTGTTTDVDGNFEIAVPSTQGVLRVTYVGYNEMELFPKNNMLVELVSATHNLDEAVVVGYGRVKKSDLTGSVSSIKSSDINVMSSVNVQSAMTGRAAGVQVVNSGSVDGATKVRVRGIGTINNADPLYVVDGFATSDISYLSPSDIQSIEVLKDASATAIYGSRGANGVIMVTTTKGKKQPTQISVNTFWGGSTTSKTMDVLDAVDYAKARTEAYANGNMQMDPDDVTMLNYAIQNNRRGTDWQKEVLRTGYIQNYNINATGGSDAGAYNLSTTYDKANGVLKNAFVDKLMIRLNTDYQLYKNVRLGTDVSFVDYKSSISDLSNMYGATLMLAARSAPVSPIFDQFGNWQPNMSRDSNPVRKSQQAIFDKKGGTQYVGNFYLNIDLMKGLSFKSSFGAAYSFSRQNNYIPQFFVSPQETVATSQLTEYRSTGLNWVWSNYATYNFTLNEAHRFTAMLGTEATYDAYNGIYATGFDVSEKDDMRYLSAAKSSSFTAGSSQGVSSIFSTFLRANYAYANKYLLTATVRSDISSRFAKENRQGIFPSVSAGWNIREENFMKNVDFLTQLKLRAGWGLVGNQSSTGLTDYLATIANGKRYVLGGNVVEGRIPDQLSNPNLTWEEAESTNIGLDLGFFKGKLTATADYFIKNTNEMIVRAPIPSYVGADAPLANVGSMRNSGFELTANYIDAIGNVKYNLGANISFIENKVTSLGTSGAIYSTLFDRMPSSSITAVGHPIATYWGYNTAGIFHSQDEVDAYTYKDEAGKEHLIQPNAQPGDVKYVDLNNDGQIDSKDQTFLGDYVPKFAGGFNLGLEFKNFTFSVFSDFSYGGKIANMNMFFLKSPIVGGNILQSYYNNRWTPETPNNNEPRLTTSSASSQNTLFSDRYIEDGSYLRIRNMQIGYNFPREMISRLKMSALRVYLSTDNLVTFTKYSGFNPEVSDQWGNPLTAGSDVGSTPLPRTFTVGFNLNF